MNLWLIIAVHRKHNLSSCEIKAWKKKSDLNEIRTQELCDIGDKRFSAVQIYDIYGKYYELKVTAS